MTAKTSEFALVKVSARRFVVARRGGQFHFDRTDQPAWGYAAVTCPLPYKVAYEILGDVCEYGITAITSAAKVSVGITKGQKAAPPGARTNVPATAPAVQPPAQARPRPVVVRSGFAAEWD